MIPGIYPDIPFAEYAMWEGVNQSVLKRALRSLAHCRVPVESTDAMELGNLTHSYILSPDELLTRYVVAPKCDRRTKVGKADWEAFTAGNGDRIIVDAEDLAAAQAMRKAVMEHPTASGMIAECRRELSVLWEVDGTPCKARIDLACEDYLADLKTTRDASPQWFPSEAAKHGYHIQAAWYLRAMAASNWPAACEDYRIIAVEKEPPYAVCVYTLDGDDIVAGYAIGERLLREYADAKRLDIWPGYPESAQPLRLPEWSRREQVDAVDGF